tara:strand:+ start:523 stop:1185 length:663 start_codon:yes stop_codon:yes gene_type:complete
MATQRAQSAGGSINNDGGIVIGVRGDNIGTDSPMSSGVNGLFGGLDQTGTGTEYGSEVKEVDRGTNPFHDHVGIQAANSSGAFAFTPDPRSRSASDQQFIIRGVSTKIGNQSNTILQSAGAQNKGANNYGSKIVNSTKMHGSGAAIDVLEPTSSGIAPFRTKGSGAGNPVTFITPSGLTGDQPSDVNDIKPTRAVPGELAYMQGGVTPKQDDYKDKDSNE